MHFGRGRLDCPIVLRVRTDGFTNLQHHIFARFPSTDLRETAEPDPVHTRDAFVRR